MSNQLKRRSIQINFQMFCFIGTEEQTLICLLSLINPPIHRQQYNTGAKGLCHFLIFKESLF